MKPMILLLFLAQSVAAAPIWKPTPLGPAPLRPAAEVEPAADNNVDPPGAAEDWAAPDAPDAPPAEEGQAPEAGPYTPNWALLTGVGDLGILVGVFVGATAGERLCPNERTYGDAVASDFERCGSDILLGGLVGGLLGGPLAIDLVGDALLEDGASGSGWLAGMGLLGGLLGSTLLAFVSPELGGVSFLVLPTGLGSLLWMQSIERPPVQVQAAAHLTLRVAPWVARVGESGTVAGLSILGSSF